MFHGDDARYLFTVLQVAEDFWFAWRIFFVGNVSEALVDDSMHTDKDTFDTSCEVSRTQGGEPLMADVCCML